MNELLLDVYNFLKYVGVKIYVYGIGMFFGDLIEVFVINFVFLFLLLCRLYVLEKLMWGYIEFVLGLCSIIFVFVLGV